MAARRISVTARNLLFAESKQEPKEGVAATVAAPFSFSQHPKSPTPPSRRATQSRIVILSAAKPACRRQGSLFAFFCVGSPLALSVSPCPDLTVVLNSTGAWRTRSVLRVGALLAAPAFDLLPHRPQPEIAPLPSHTPAPLRARHAVPAFNVAQAIIRPRAAPSPNAHTNPR